MWQPDRGPDPTTSKFAPESATTEAEKQALNKDFVDIFILYTVPFRKKCNECMTDLRNGRTVCAPGRYFNHNTTNQSLDKQYKN